MDQQTHKSFVLRWLVSFLLLITSSCQVLGFGQSENTCGPSTLKMGEAVYEIKTVKPKSDGSLNIPADKPDNAFWVQDTTTNQVFGLSPTENNLALQSSLTEGDTIQVNWENCNSTTYQFASLQPGVPEHSTLLDQSISQVTIVVGADSPGGFVVTGKLAEETITVGNTPDASEIQAEISVLNTTASPDGQTIEIEISILNYGESSFTFSAEDVSLLSENVPLILNSSEPALPYEIKPAETTTLKLIFPHPASQTALLQILDVEYEITGY